MNASRIALVTGANQGLGRALAEGLAARMDPEDLVLLTGRSHQRVSDAAREVAQLPGTHSHVRGQVLDVTDTDDIARLADELRARHGGVDVVLSNAVTRLLPEESQAERADEFIDVSNTATHAILRSFGPVLRPGGRLIVVASSLGTLGHLDPRLHHLFDGASLDQVEYAVESWRSAIHNRTAEEAGWPRWLNVPSKVAQVAAVRAVAAERRERDLADGTLIASVCPGMVDTATSRPWFSDFSQAQSPSEAAGAVLDLVFTEHVDPALYGELIRFGKALPWHDGTPPVEQDRLLRP
ncbi:MULTISPECIES: SDR family oxidoreductase [unclassified Streptomyces]|uniref:SDR family NAD(P)-dependent oxidoreductase n=1 Tax=unclassified Streptomyces TaxID=2593676 RepID=UPI0011655DF2|nr:MULTISPECIES: SDR family NAD(P)-dependent oxidoreductase [unclassified Streptomyces]NMI54956.1 SDR family NAD(P)-dependent oxidoreductase [Streptomyces sp. RLA2-12]QDN62528.1 SDR family NAD(P)-dependent oxidoreductase [Streptomyces sp. S1D4-20]QDN72579.1 SDR family NAD(P)-dependent oxidoreductase [Streptomyces sp. S1D4-14]QDO55108.1 SDR family NAD(P)-dependent oxidoreductase [Streptomyces sp. RLB3-5]QDO65281.1 SDR family NAD(P)-dependent oxidoreductase [Streptomyces sp. RLB1-8]